MPDLLHRFVAAWRLELRLICRHWAYPLLLAAWPGLVVLIYRDVPFLTAEGMLLGERDEVNVAGLVALAALFLGATSAARSERVKLALLEESFPTGAEVPLGRWLAGVVALLPVLLPPLVIAYRIGPSGSFWRSAPVFVAELLIAIAFAAALAWLLVNWVGPRRWLYPLLAGIWLGGLYGAVLLVAGAPWYYPAAGLLDFTRSGMADTYGGRGHYQELWGRLLRGPLPRWFDLFYLGFAIVLAALLATRTHLRRQRRLPVVAGSVLLATLALTSTAGIAYVAQVRSWTAQAVDASHYDDRTYAPLESPIAIDAWQIEADLRQPARPTFTAAVTLRNDSTDPLTDATLTLNRDLTIRESSVPVTREGEHLRLALPQPLPPGASITVRLVYQGAIEILWRSSQGLAEPIFFTDARGVRLSLPAGWYPLPGEFPLDSTRVNLQHPPAAFSLTVQAPQGFGVISNLPRIDDGTFAAEQASWAFVLAAPRLRVEQAGTITIAAPEAAMASLRAVAERSHEVQSRLRPFFPDKPPARLTVALPDQWQGTARGLPTTSAPADDQHLILAHHNGLIRLHKHVTPLMEMTSLVHPITESMLMEGSSGLPWSMLGVNPFLAAYLLEEGDPDRMAAALNSLQHTDAWDIEVALALNAVYRAQGEAGVAQVLAEMRTARDHLAEMHPMEMPGWITEVADGR